jgi:D-alanyl-D-alanine carboxypeptidase
LNRREALRAVAGLATFAIGCRSQAPTRADREPVAPAPVPAPPRIDARWERVVGVFEQSLERFLAPGGAIGVVVDGKPGFITARGVRKLGTSTPVTTSTLFRVESVTKTFTALAALALVEKGALDLDAAIAGVVPWVSFADGADGRKVTLRRLLTHTAGLTRNQIVKLRDVRPGSEYEDLFGKNPLALGPVDRFEYSNTGYVLVGAAIERAAKTRFDDAFKTLVTKPLGMGTATTDSSIAATREHADGFGMDWDGRERSFDPPSLDAYVQRPVGGLHASIEELALFASRLLAGVPEILRRETFADMTRKHATAEEGQSWYGYGLYGVDSARGPVWTHTGSGHGSSGYFACAPRERFAVVAITNAGRYGGWRDVRRAAEEAFIGAPLF